MALLLSVVWSATASAATHKLGVIIGNNRGHQPERALQFAEQDARKIHSTLVELGGFEPDALELVAAATAERVWAALARAEARAAALAGEAGEETLLLVYYSGHADGDVLELGDSSLSFAQLRRYLDTSTATVRLAIIDSCQSGKLVSFKGGRRGPAFEIRVANEIASKGFAVITSSAGDELSQESAEIRGSLFTHHWVSAMRGAADGNGDGKVTLTEAYQHAYNHTVAQSSTSLGGGQHPMYEFRIEGRGEIVLTRPTSSRTSLLIHAPRAGRVVVIDVERQAVVAEASVEAAGAVRVGLASGHYRAYLLSGERALRADAQVPATGDGEIAADAFEEFALRRAVGKGGLFAPNWAHQISAWGLVRGFPLDGTAVSWGAAFQYRLEWTPGWSVAARLAGSAAPEAGASRGYFDLGLSVGVGYLWVMGPVGIRLDILAGYEHLFQDGLPGVTRNTPGLAYGGRVGLEVPWRGLAFGLDGAVGGRLFQVRDAGWEHALDWQILLGVGWALTD